MPLAIGALPLPVPPYVIALGRRAATPFTVTRRSAVLPCLGNRAINTSGAAQRIWPGGRRDAVLLHAHPYVVQRGGRLKFDPAIVIWSPPNALAGRTRC